MLKNRPEASDIALLDQLRSDTGGVYSTADLSVLTSKKRGVSLSKTITRLAKGGWIGRVRNGLYADLLHGHSPELLGQRWVEPSYLSAEKALEIHGLVDTGVLTYTYVTSRVLLRRTDSSKTFGKDRYLYRHISPKYYFGFDSREGVLLASPEKAALDFLYFRFKGSALLFSAEDVRWKKLRRGELLKLLKLFPKAFQTWTTDLLDGMGVR